MVDLSIKNVPEELAEYLRRRAEDNNRSLQGELLTILEESVRPDRLSLEEADERLRKLDLTTGDEATNVVRQDRDAR